MLHTLPWHPRPGATEALGPRRTQDPVWSFLTLSPQLRQWQLRWVWRTWRRRVVQLQVAGRLQRRTEGWVLSQVQGRSPAPSRPLQTSASELRGLPACPPGRLHLRGGLVWVEKLAWIWTSGCSWQPCAQPGPARTQTGNELGLWHSCPHTAAKGVVPAHVCSEHSSQDTGQLYSERLHLAGGSVAACPPRTEGRTSIPKGTRGAGHTQHRPGGRGEPLLPLPVPGL